MPSSDKRDGWVEGWFTKPGLYWCATKGLRKRLVIAQVEQGANGLFAHADGGFLATYEVTHWLDAEIEPPALPEGSESDGE